jgi:hypothetical protein
MSQWVDGYRAALADVRRLAFTRLGPLTELLADLEGDALVIEREQDNRIRRRRLAAVREATLPFDEPPP